MKIYTDLDTLTEAWNILDELELSGLLDGSAIKIEVAKLLNGLLRQGKLKAFLSIITKSEVTNIEGKEASRVIMVFFVSLGNEWGALPGMLISMSPKATSESQ